MTAPTAADPFFRSHWVTPPVGVVEHPASRLAPGFRAGTASAGLKGEGRTDVGLLLCESADPR
ncbi:MAG: bifunctional glutamate N-acetyltransferase/amino-acid acetyltransferase ArgJ, partial [Solirubrobacterales bacterium]